MKIKISILDFKEYQVEIDQEIEIVNDILDEYNSETNFFKHEEIIKLDNDLIVQHNIDEKYLGFNALIQPIKQTESALHWCLTLKD